MSQAIEIYYNDIKIAFTETVDNNFNDNNTFSFSNSILDTLVMSIKNTTIKSDIALLCTNTKDSFKDFKKSFKYIKAAGGLVKSKDDRFLIIKRFGLWDLPKGKVDKGEKIEDAAIREVVEETCVSDLEVIKPLPSSFHIYYSNHNWILKRTYWFLMKTDKCLELTPQKSEDITEAIWMEKQLAKNAIKNSYRSISDTFEKIF